MYAHQNGINALTVCTGYVKSVHWNITFLEFEWTCRILAFHTIAISMETACKCRNGQPQSCIFITFGKYLLHSLTVLTNWNWNWNWNSNEHRHIERAKTVSASNAKNTHEDDGEVWVECYSPTATATATIIINLLVNRKENAHRTRQKPFSNGNFINNSLRFVLALYLVV